MGVPKNDESIFNFYTIPLGEGDILTEDELNSSADKRTIKQPGWFYPDLKLHSFTNGTAEIINKSNKASFRLRIKAEPGKLHVSCSCGMQSEKLCVHAFNALDRLVRYDDGGADFKKFMPGGAAQTVAEYRRFFETKPGLSNMFKPKAELGSVYGIKEAMKEYNIADVLVLPAAPATTKATPDTAMCYIIMYSRRDDFLPFLLPCMGRLNKAGDRIKQFGNFLSGIQKEYDTLLTDEQRALNSICLELWKQVEKLPHELIHEDMSYNGTDELVNVFNLWRKAIPLLAQQHAYLHPYFYKRQLKGKPSLSRIEKITVQKAVPVIQFRLTDKGAFYQLEMRPAIYGKPVSDYEITDTFFIRQGDDIYMLSSVRDAAIAEWMEKSDNRITVFKNYFPRFESDFLQPLKKYYEVKK